MRNWEFYLAVVRRLTCARPSAACRFNGLVYAKDAKVLCLRARGGRPPPPMRPNTHMGRGRAGRRVELWVPSAPHVGEMSRPGERWPIVLAMRNGEYYLTVVAAPIDRRQNALRHSRPVF